MPRGIFLPTLEMRFSSPFKVPQGNASFLDPASEVEFTEGADDKTPGTIFLKAYTGVPAIISHFPYPVIVNIAGTRFAKPRTPILMDHSTNNRIGHITDRLILQPGERKTFQGKQYEGPMVLASGIKSSSSALAKGFVEDSKSGFPFQASIGASIVRGSSVFYEEGEFAEVNGRQWPGPLIVADKSLIKEISVTVFGADGNTESLAASYVSEMTMGYEDFLANLCEELGWDAANLSGDQENQAKNLFAKFSKVTKTPPKKTTRTSSKTPVDPPANLKAKGGDGDDLASYRRKRAADEARLDALSVESAKFAERIETIPVGDEKMTLTEFKMHAIETGMSVADFKVALYENAMPTRTTPAIHIKDRKIEAAALECSILKYSGMPEDEVNAVNGKKYGLTRFFDEKTMDKADEREYKLNGSIDQLLRMQILAAGMYPTEDRDSLLREAHAAWEKVQYASGGFSTLNIVNILENTMNKAAMAGFTGVESIWPYIVGRHSVNDFRPTNLYTLEFDGSYRKVAADGVLKHISMVDSKKSISIETYGAMIAIDRKTQINDDLGLVVNKARSLGTLGGQRIEESVFVTLLSNPSSFFSVGNGNLISGGTSPLSVTSLTTAKMAFRNQVVNGKPVSVSPRILLTGTPLEETANNLMTLSQMTLGMANTDTGMVFTNNPHKGMYRPLVAPYLSNTNIRDQDGAALTGQSDTQWYLLADPNSPQGSAIAIAFLRGRETPYFDQADTQFSIPGGIQFRSYHDWGVAMHMPQLALKSAGA